MASSDRIGLVQDVESLVVTVRDAHPSGHSEPCLTALDIVISKFEGQFIATHGIVDRAQLKQDTGSEIIQTKFIRWFVGDGEAPIHQSQRLIIMVIRCLKLRCLKVRPWSSGIVGAIQVLRVQYGVAIGEPFGGGSVKLDPLGLEQRDVYAFLYQGMGDQIVFTLRAHEVMLD